MPKDTSKPDKGIALLAERIGSGPRAVKGSTVVYNARLFLRRGDEVTLDQYSITRYRDRLSTHRVEDVELIDHRVILGRRQPIAAVEKALYGMRAGGYREILASPHLCYGARGIANRIPVNAMLRIRLWVHTVS